MAGFEDILVDRNGDGLYDDATVRFVVTPDGTAETSEFWRRLLDLAGRIGLESQALPLPLFIGPGERPVGDDVGTLTIQSEGDIQSLEVPFASSEAPTTISHGHACAQSDCLLDLFTPSGLLVDRDGDLLPDATRVTFDLPEALPLDVGAALANLAARIGLESGGVTFPLAGDGPHPLRIRITDDPASFATDGDGWQVSGDARSVAALLNRIATDWPHFGQPDTAGAGYGVDWLGRALAGDVPGSQKSGAPRWEMQWSAEPETKRLLDSIDRTLVPRVTADEPVQVIAFVCEPLGARRRLAEVIRLRLERAGALEPRVTVLCSFKVGLSWLREVVLPELRGQDVARLAITYRRFEAAQEGGHLDLPIRWLQELFPGNEIAARELGLPLDAVTLAETTEPAASIFNAVAFDAGGMRLGGWSCDLMWRTLPFLPHAPEEGHVAVTTGGYIARVRDETLQVPVETDLERFWAFWQGEVLRRLLREIETGGGLRAERQPFFGALEVDVWISSPNERLGVREENDSAAEALHEDIYFNTLDTLEVLGERATGEKTSAPGAVVPIVHVVPGVTPHAVVRLRHAPPRVSNPVSLRVAALELADGELLARIEARDGRTLDPPASLVANSSQHSDLQSTGLKVILKGAASEQRLRLPLPRILGELESEPDGPPMDVNIHGDAVLAWTARLGAAPEVSAWVEDYSYQGRPIAGMALRSPAPGRFWSAAKLAMLKPTAMIVARHHANEISSTNAALRLAHLCSTDPDWTDLLKHVNVVVIPYENADGAALHARLAAVPGAENWKHHPARYNALGHEFSEDFFKPDTAFGEARVRPAIWRRWLPDVVVDNHGVPSHEWIQPFAGFGSPPRFRVSYWIPQALIYGIVRYVEDDRLPEHARAASALRDAVSAAVRDTDIGELNQEIGASYRLWGQAREPESFPGEFHDDMLWHISTGEADPESRGFNARFPSTTVLSWVTEVNDETATGEHLERVARAHLLANRAMLDLLVAASPEVVREIVTDDGRTTLRVGRRRPLKLG
jgi:hypothetical protein